MHDGSLPRVLILVSGDFGELANAIGFLDGTRAEARLLLPPNLLGLNPELPPHAVAGYHSVADVSTELGRFRPQIFLLMSAYLFSLNALLSLRELQQLLDEADALHAVVGTTDPFLGAQAEISSQKFSAQGAAFANHLAVLRDLLRTRAHLYPSPMHQRSGASFLPPRLSYFNPRGMATSAVRSSVTEDMKESDRRVDPAFWLFILSGEDYRVQCGAQGQPAFDDLLARILDDAVEAGRMATLIAPMDVCVSLSTHANSSVSLLTFCDYARFRKLLLTAEHVFYWNVLSNSILVRAANGRSVFFFDVGHLSRYLPQIHSLAMDAYFGNAPLPMLDCQDRIDPGTLARGEAIQREDFAPALRALLALPTPDEILTSLLDEKSS